MKGRIKMESLVTPSLRSGRPEPALSKAEGAG